MSKTKSYDIFWHSHRFCWPVSGMMQALPFLAFDTIIIAGLVVWNAVYVYLMAANLHMNDFGKFYYSVVAFMQGQDMYGPNPATLIPVSDTANQQFWNMNPPHFHLPILPLGLLPPGVALALWMGAGFFCLLTSLRLIVREVALTLTPWTYRLAIVGLLSFAGTGAVCVTGQLSFFLLLPVTIAWIKLRRGQWNHGGLYLGLAMSVKPFLLIFLPYLIVRRQFRALVTACATAIGCFAAGLLVFGVDTHWSWFHAMAASNWAWAGMNASTLGWLTRTFTDNPTFAPLTVVPALVGPLWLMTAGLIGLVTLAASASDKADTAADRDFALLLLGAQLIGPLGWIYYLWLPLGPMTALTASWWSGREPRRAFSACRAVRWRKGLVLGALPGLVWPLQAVMIFQPHPLATVSVSSIYFWATFGLWSSLIVDRICDG
jgi:alpha-1,2-mannosyltransferase